MDWAVQLTPGPLREVAQRVTDALPDAATRAGGVYSELHEGDAKAAVKAAETLARQLGARPDSTVAVAVSGSANPERGPTADGKSEQLAVVVTVSAPGA